MCICNDRRWPETFRVMGLQDVENGAARLQHADAQHPSRRARPSAHVSPTSSPCRPTPTRTAPGLVATAKAGKEDGFGMNRRLLHHRARPARSRGAGAERGGRGHQSRMRPRPLSPTSSGRSSTSPSTGRIEQLPADHRAHGGSAAGGRIGPGPTRAHQPSPASPAIAPSSPVMKEPRSPVHFSFQADMRRTKQRHGDECALRQDASEHRQKHRYHGYIRVALGKMADARLEPTKPARLAARPPRGR